MKKITPPASRAPLALRSTREDWLNQAAALLRPHFAGAGFPLPERIRMTCGFPSKSALSKRNQRVGECWTAESSGDKHHEIFISPVLDEPVEVLETLTHELSHAAVGVKHKHRGPFVKCVRALHLEGKPASTEAGEAFKQQIAKSILQKIGKYPHARLVASANPKKQTTRLIKCVCEQCDYTARTTRKWLDTAGAPICPACEIQMEADEPETEEDGE